MKKWIAFGLCLALVPSLLIVRHYEQRLDDLEDFHEYELKRVLEGVAGAIQSGCRILANSTHAYIFSDMVNITDEAIERDPRGRLEPPTGTEILLAQHCLTLYLGRRAAKKISAEYIAGFNRIWDARHANASTAELNALTLDAYQSVYDELRQAMELRPERSYFIRRVVVWVRWYNEIESVLW